MAKIDQETLEAEREDLTGIIGRMTLSYEMTRQEIEVEIELAFKRVAHEARRIEASC